MNKIVLVGRLVADPEMRATPQGVSVCNLRLAVPKKSDREQSYFFNVTAWRGLADTCGKYLVKGQRVAVAGELQTRDYEDRDGHKRTAVYVNAEDMDFLDRPKGVQQNAEGSVYASVDPPPEMADFDDVQDDLPF